MNEYYDDHVAVKLFWSFIKYKNVCYWGPPKSNEVICLFGLALGIKQKQNKQT